MNEERAIDFDELKQWLDLTRKLLKQFDRVDIGDEKIGELLANSPPDEDGLWPCRPVCRALESISSDHIITGFEVGIKNLRGVQIRDEGGQQERNIAQRYRECAHERRFEFPFVGKLLDRIAESFEKEAKWWDEETYLQTKLQGY